MSNDSLFICIDHVGYAVHNLDDALERGIGLRAVAGGAGFGHNTSGLCLGDHHR